jgi:phage antirepressor YoqD-like protein
MVSDLLPIQSINNVDVVDSRLIAIELGIQHKNFYQAIKDNQIDIEQAFGHLLFETDTVKNSVGAVNEVKFAYLNEDQATYLMTLSRNTPQVKKLKLKLVKSFSYFKKANKAIKLPTDYLEALKCLVSTEEEKLKLQAETERQKLIISIKDETIEAQQGQITEWHPLVENYKQFLDSTGLIGMSQAAKMLAGEKSGRNRLIQVLRLYGFLYAEKNEPLQKWMKYFAVKVKTRKHPNSKGEYKTDPVTLFTPDGLNKIVKIMENKAGSRELLLGYLKNPETLVARLTQEKEGKRNVAITAIEDALPEEEMTLLDHLNEAARLGFYKGKN